MMIDKRVAQRIERILELPKLIDATGRKLAGLRSDRRKTEMKLKAREATIRKELLTLDIYKSCSNADERAAVYEDAKHSDPAWEDLQERFEQLTVLIEMTTNEREALDHERKALKAALEREYAEIIERVLTDRMLAESVAKGRVAA
jgi:hypothetical protein